MAEKENNKRHESTIDKYFAQTAKAYKTWAEEDEEARNYLQIAIEPTGDPDENGDQGFDFHIAYHGKTISIAECIAQSMQRDKFIRDIVIKAAGKFLMNK